MGHYECRTCDQRYDLCTCVVKSQAPGTLPAWWTLTESDAIMAVRTIEAEVSKFGWHVALGGSVLHKGGSGKDLDLVAYPHKRYGIHCPNKRPLRAALERIGMKIFMTRKQVAKKPTGDGTRRDRKWVEVWRTSDGRRVDLMILS